MIRLGIIGCGSITGYYDGFSSGALSSRVQVTALVDHNRQQAEIVAQQFDHPIIATELNDAVLNVVDAVLIALPHHLHFPYGKRCLESGKHVLMEKPLALNEKQCLILKSLSEHNQLILMTALCMRFHPLVQQFKELIDQKIYGDIFQLSIWTEQHTELPKTHWMTQQKTSGGGQLFNHGCHYIDLLLWILGNPIALFFMGSNKGTPWMEAEGTTHVCMKFKTGTMGYYFGTWGARGSHNDYRMEAHCERGLVALDLTRSKITAYTQGTPEDTKQFYMGYTKETVLTDDPVPISTMYHNELAHFIDCIETRRSPTTNAKTALAGLQLIWKLYKQDPTENTQTPRQKLAKL